MLIAERDAGGGLLICRFMVELNKASHRLPVVGLERATRLTLLLQSFVSVCVSNYVDSRVVKRN